MTFWSITRRSLLAVGAGTAALGIAGQLHAQDVFPSKPVKILVGAGPVNKDAP